MADEPGVKVGELGAPASSPDANQPAGAPPENAEPGVKGPDGKPLTFNDVLKHPEFQPFLQRQIEDQVASRTADAVAKVLEQAGVVKPNAPPDDDSEDAKQIMANFDITEEKARELVQWRNRGITKKTKQLENRFDTLDLSMRFAQVYRENDDAKQFEGKMLELFNGMNEFEKNFILRSKDGASYLYEQAKRRSGVVPTYTRIAGGGGGGGSSSSRSVPPSEKTGSQDVQVGQAVAALKGGNRAEYERIMKTVVRA